MDGGARAAAPNPYDAADTTAGRWAYGGIGSAEAAVAGADAYGCWTVAVDWADEIELLRVVACELAPEYGPSRAPAVWPLNDPAVRRAAP